MKPSRHLASSLLLTAALLAPGFAMAEETGLRVAPQKWTIKGKDSPQGLQFSIGNDDLGVGPLSLMPNVPRLYSPSSFSASRSTNTWADWQPFNNGWRTSAGLVWRQTLVVDPISGNTGESSATPFLGVGWSGAPVSQSNWKLSAEMGAYVGANGECGLSSGCPSGGIGLRASSSSSGGMRVTPYLSVGASYLY